MEKEIYLQTHFLNIGYRKPHPLASGLELSLRAGDVVSLIGSNGIGKSTLMRTLAGDLKPLAGSIELRGEPLTALSPRQRALRLALVETSAGAMSGGLSVRQFVELGRQPHTGLLGILSEADKQICSQAMQATGIAPKSDAFISTLSDGERQKAMIARALAQDTPVIFLDEPFSFLDPAARLEVMKMLTDIARRQSKAILLTCHDVALSLRMSSRMWLFTREGSVEDLLPEEALAGDILDHLYKSENVKFSAQIGDFVITE